MKKSCFVAYAGAVLTLMTGLARADIGLNLKAGTLGAGVELSRSFGEKFSVGLGINAYDLKTTDSSSDIDYDFNFDLQSVALLGNYHPFGGVFRLTAGALYNKNELKLTGKPSAGSTYSINGVSYTAAQVGTLTGTLTFNSIAPYFGLGWGNRPGGKLGLSADVGVLHQGSPKLALSATGALSNPTLAADLERERQSAESDLSDFKWYPVVSLGLYYRF